MCNIYFFICKVSSLFLFGFWFWLGYSGVLVVFGCIYLDNEFFGKFFLFFLIGNW